MGSAFGPLLGGIANDYLGRRISFAVPAVAFAILGFLLLPMAKVDKTNDQGARPLQFLEGYRLVLASPSARLLCLVVGIEGFLFYGAFGFGGAFLRHQFELNYTVIGIALAGFGIGGLIYSATVKALVSRLGARKMVIGGGWLMMIGFVALAFAPIWQMAPLAILILGFSFYLLHNTLQTRATEMVPEARGSAISAFASCLFVGQAIGVWVLGEAIEVGGYQLMLSATGLLLLVLGHWFSRRLATL